MSTRDPAHPANLIRSAKEIQLQAAADAEYDMPAPKRFRSSDNATNATEGFRSPFREPSDIMLAMALLALTFFVWLATKDSMRTLYALVFLLVTGIMFLIHKKAFDP